MSPSPRHRDTGQLQQRGIAQAALTLSDTAEFAMTASAPGSVTLAASVSFEVHIGYPGPAYWGYAASPPLTIEVVG